MQYSPDALQFFPPHFTAYDKVHRHFFVSNTTQNRIDVFDTATESQIGSVIVPLPWGIDIAPDGSKLYVATTFGDIYLADPVALSVIQRFPSATIGSQGYAAIQPYILASGQLALLGGIAALNVDGSQTFAIWDPTTNNLQVLNADVFGNPAFVNIGQMSLTSDRTKVVVSSADSDGTLGLYQPSTGPLTTGRADGIVCEILPTPDGSRLFMTHEGGEFEVYDANTLTLLGSFASTGTGSYSAVLSHDGSTLLSTDLLGNVSAYDTATFGQKGWVPNFEVVDLQQNIVLSASDETDLIVGPIGHGVAFLDGTQIPSGLAQTVFSVGFLSPGMGTANGGTAIQAQVSRVNAPGSGPNITSGTIYIGNATANNVSLSNTIATGLAPPASASGPADFTVVLPDGSIQLNPENFSYGPTIVELSTNAASAEGGSQGVIFGYGLGQQASDVSVNVGGRPAAVTQVIPSVSPISRYPFPMEAVLFTIPAGTPGSAASVTATTATGSASSTSMLHYVPAVQTFELPGAALMQGLYDPTRGIVYFTDKSQIDAFSLATNNWLAPIVISFTNTNSRLLGVALSPDGNMLAVSDAGNANIYVLNPSSPSTAKSFHIQPAGVGNLEPYGLVVTNSGIVYYGSFDADVDPQDGFHKLNTSTATITDFTNPPSLRGGDSFIRILMSSDGSSVYDSGGGCPAVLDTANDSISAGTQACNTGDGNEDMALSGDGTVVLASDLVTDKHLNVESDIAYVDRDVWLPVAVFGQKLSSDGSMAFTPLSTGIDVHDSLTGLLAYRVELPIQIANVYDALAVDDKDDLLFAITANGIAEIDLSSLPVPTSKSRAAYMKVSPYTAYKKTTSSDVFHKNTKTSQLERPHLLHLIPLH